MCKINSCTRIISRVPCTIHTIHDYKTMFAWLFKTKKITPILLVSKIGYDESQSLPRG